MATDLVFHCPACDRGYPDLEALRTHLKKAEAEGDTTHIDVVNLEGWDETSAGVIVKKASDLETT